MSDASDPFLHACPRYREARRLGARSGNAFIVSPKRTALDGVVNFVRIMWPALVILGALIWWTCR